jgi:hypothetical protein
MATYRKRDKDSVVITHEGETFVMGREDLEQSLLYIEDERYEYKSDADYTRALGVYRGALAVLGVKHG